MHQQYKEHHKKCGRKGTQEGNKNQFVKLFHLILDSFFLRDWKILSRELSLPLIMSPKDTNLSLNDDELSFLANGEIFLKKRQLSDHIIDILGDIEAHIQETTVDYVHKIPESALIKRGKISRGENYLNYPWFLLDHPSTFHKEHVFAFRTLVWWGNYFAITFHVSGSYFENMEHKVFIQNLHEVFPSLQVCINENQWEHFLDRPNFIQAADYLNEFNEINPPKKNFLKVAFKIPFTESVTLKSKVIKFTRTVLELY